MGAGRFLPVSSNQSWGPDSTNSKRSMGIRYAKLSCQGDDSLRCPRGRVQDKCSVDLAQKGVLFPSGLGAFTISVAHMPAEVVIRISETYIDLS